MTYSMDRVLILVTQLRNLTPKRVGYRVPHGLHLIRNLPSGRTRSIKQRRILRFCRENGPDWTVGILVDGNYTGVELSSSHLLKYARIIFRYVENRTGENVLVVDGIKENPYSDYLLRLRYFGWMRNIFWDKRPIVEIARSDSRVATKLRGIEAIVTTTRPHRQTASSANKAEKLTEIPVYNSSTIHGNKSSARPPVSSRLVADSGNTKGPKPEKQNVGDQNVMDKSKKYIPPDGKLHHVNNVVPLNNVVPPPQPTRRNAGIPLPPLTNSIGFSDTPDYYLDDFVNVLLFGFALLFVVFLRMWIG